MWRHKHSGGSPDISWRGVTTVISDLGHWVTHWNKLLQTLLLWSFCGCQSVLYHVNVSVCNLACDYAHLSLSRDGACQSVSITWLCFQVCVYHVTACQSVLYDVTVLVGLCLSCDSACRSVFITWLHLWPVLYHVTVPVSLCSITWLRLWSVLYYVTALVSLCSITWLCLSVCIYHVIAPLVCVLSRDCAGRSVFITWLYLSLSDLSYASVQIHFVYIPNYSRCKTPWP